MSLSSLKQYLMDVKKASLLSMSVYFDADPDVIRCKLQHWINKGCVRKCMKTALCGDKCNKCAAIVTENYEWIAFS